jgi:hypothetical protein
MPERSDSVADGGQGGREVAVQLGGQLGIGRRVHCVEGAREGQYRFVERALLEGNVASILELLRRGSESTVYALMFVDVSDKEGRKEGTKEGTM